MKTGSRYKVKRRRRREGKTNYRRRYKLVTSDKPRLVIRPTNKNIYAQIITSKLEGDTTLVSCSSQELMKDFNWKGGSSNLPAAYLLGYLCGLKSKKEKIDTAILDMGLFEATKGNKIFASLKGANEAGLNISHSNEVLPDDSRLYGKHIASVAEKIKKENNMFSKLSKKIDIKKYPDHVTETKSKIDSKFGVGK